MTEDDLYFIHNKIMEAAHRELQEVGLMKTAEEMQKLAQDYHGSIIMHELIHTTLKLIDTTMQLTKLDKSTEPNQYETD